MATILYVSTYGSDDPTRATLPFVATLVTPKEFAEFTVAADRVVSG